MKAPRFHVAILRELTLSLQMDRKHFRLGNLARLRSKTPDFKTLQNSCIALPETTDPQSPDICVRLCHHIMVTSTPRAPHKAGRVVREAATWWHQMKKGRKTRQERSHKHKAFNVSSTWRRNVCFILCVNIFMSWQRRCVLHFICVCRKQRRHLLISSSHKSRCEVVCSSVHHIP